MYGIVRFILLVCLALFSGSMLAQDLAESSLATGSSSGASAGMQKAGQGIATALRKAVGTLESAAKAAKNSPPQTAVRTVEGGTGSAPPVKLAAPDHALIKAGMDREELLKKFGEPAMRISANDGAQVLETWDYGTPPETVTVKLRGGKVESIIAPASNKKEPAAAGLNPYQAGTAVVVLQ